MKTPENVPDNNVGRKTPEEIKQGLVVCYSEDDGGCIECPFRIAGYTDELDCYEQLKRDAFDLILRLESRLAQAERERDELFKYLPHDCTTCRFELTCERSDECDLGELWQWRGICPENTKEAES